MIEKLWFSLRISHNTYCFQMLQTFLPSMIEKNHGHVVALSSIAGLGGLPNLVPYCASKFAVRGKFSYVFGVTCERIYDGKYFKKSRIL